MKILSISLHWRVPVAFPFILSRALPESQVLPPPGSRSPPFMEIAQITNQ